MRTRKLTKGVIQQSISEYIFIVIKISQLFDH